MKDVLNQRIKRRESFRPFVPSIFHEAASEWFETDHDVPFMMKVFQIREKKRREIAVSLTSTGQVGCKQSPGTRTRAITV